MDAVTRHDIGSAAKNARRILLHVHQVEKPEFPFLVVEKQVNVEIVVRVTARGRAEHVKLLHAEPPQLGFVLFELSYGLVAVHVASVAEFGRPRIKGEAARWLARTGPAGWCQARARGSRHLRPPPPEKAPCVSDLPRNGRPRTCVQQTSGGGGDAGLCQGGGDHGGSVGHLGGVAAAGRLSAGGAVPKPLIGRGQPGRRSRPGPIMATRAKGVVSGFPHSAAHPPRPEFRPISGLSGRNWPTKLRARGRPVTTGLANSGCVRFASDLCKSRGLAITKGDWLMRDEIHAAYEKHRRFKEAGNHGDYEHMLKATYSRFVAQGDNVIDVGAADGFHALPLSELVGSDGRVYAFEPLAADYGCWDRYLAERQNLRLLAKAVTDTVGETRIYRYAVIGEVTGLSGLRQRRAYYNRDYNIDSPVEIEATTLDASFAALAQLKYVKIDIEGGRNRLHSRSDEFTEETTPSRVLRTRRAGFFLLSIHRHGNRRDVRVTGLCSVRYIRDLSRRPGGPSVFA